MVQRLRKRVAVTMDVPIRQGGEESALNMGLKRRLVVIKIALTMQRMEESVSDMVPRKGLVAMKDAQIKLSKEEYV